MTKEFKVKNGEGLNSNFLSNTLRLTLTLKIAAFDNYMKKEFGFIEYFI